MRLIHPGRSTAEVGGSSPPRAHEVRRFLTSARTLQKGAAQVSRTLDVGTCTSTLAREVPTDIAKTRNTCLSWKDATAAWLLAWGGGTAIAIMLLPVSRHSSFPSLSTYAAHAWFLAVALFWFFALHKPFPVGSFSRRGLRGWLWPCVVVGALILASFPFVHGGPKQPGLVVAQVLLFQAVLVGPTEEFMSRGLVQTAFNNSIAWSLGYRSLRIKGGIVLAALLFGAGHLRMPSVVR